MEAYSERYDAALVLAARAHRRQKRKGSDIPYLVHPVHVSTILLRHAFAEDVIIAGLLHDVVEDSDVSLDSIETHFGALVAEMVRVVTEKKRERGGKRSWEIRKQEALALLRQAGPDAVAVKAADTVHNARTLARQLARDGASIWDYYTRGPEQTLWYYDSVAEITAARLGTHPLVDEVFLAVRDLERSIEQAKDC
jgi:(p)ppGpp synthase/HD superfamily hydrolase